MPSLSGSGYQPTVAGLIAEEYRLATVSPPRDETSVNLTNAEAMRVPKSLSE